MCSRLCVHACGCIFADVFYVCVYMWGEHARNSLGSDSGGRCSGIHLNGCAVWGDILTVLPSAVAQAMVELAVQAGVPRHVLPLVTCSREEVVAVGEVSTLSEVVGWGLFSADHNQKLILFFLFNERHQELCTNPMVAKVSFTGSTAVGKHLARLASSSVKRVSLELVSAIARLPCLAPAHPQLPRSLPYTPPPVLTAPHPSGYSGPIHPSICRNHPNHVPSMSSCWLLDPTSAGRKRPVCRVCRRRR